MVGNPDFVLDCIDNIESKVRRSSLLEVVRKADYAARTDRATRLLP